MPFVELIVPILMIPLLVLVRKKIRVLFYESSRFLLLRFMVLLYGVVFSFIPSLYLLHIGRILYSSDIADLFLVVFGLLFFGFMLLYGVVVILMAVFNRGKGFDDFVEWWVIKA